MKLGDSSEPPGLSQGLFTLHPALDSIPTFIYVKDAERRIVSVNLACCGMLGVPRDELIGQRIVPFLGDAGDESDRIDREVLATGTPRLGYVQSCPSAQGRRWIITDKAPIRGPGGTVVGILGVSSDITAQREAELALRESEERLKFITANTADVIWTMDLSLKTTFVSQSVERILGYTPAEWLALPFDRMAAPESLQREYAELRHHLDLEASGSADPDRTVTMEVEMNHKNGSTRWMELVISSIRDESGHLVGVVGVSRDIAARNEAERALKESAALLRKTERASRLGGWHYDVATRRMTWTEGVFAIHEMEPESGVDLIAVSLSCYAPEARETVRQAFRAAVKEGKPYDLESGFTTLRGNHRWVRTTGQPELRNGAVAGVSGNIIDVTEQYEAAAALRASEEKYRQLFEQSVDAINLVSPDGRVLEANPAWYAMFGYMPKDLATYTAREAYVDPHGREHFLQQIAATDNVVDEVRFRRKDGTVFDCHRVVTARRNRDGTILGFQTVFHDVTEQKRAQHALVTSEEKYRQIFNQSLVPIALTSLDGRVIESNEAWFRLFGYTREDMLTFNTTVLFEQPEQRQPLLEVVLHEGRVDNYKSRMRRKDGTLIVVLRSISVQHNLDGSILGLQTVFQDITELCLTENELRESRDQLRRLALRMQEVREDERTVVARQLHDHFSQQLTALKLDLETTRRQYLTAEDGLSLQLRDITALVDNMAAEVRRIISEMRPGMLDDIGLCAALEWQAEQFSERSGIPCTLSLNIDDSTVSPATATALFRVFQELLSNVALHSNASLVRVELIAGADSMRLVVADNGRGILEAEVNGPRSLGVLGIKERIYSCGGTVVFQGQPGNGTVVTVEIPLQVQQQHNWQPRLKLP